MHSIGHRFAHCVLVLRLERVIHGIEQLAMVQVVTLSHVDELELRSLLAHADRAAKTFAQVRSALRYELKRRENDGI